MGSSNSNQKPRPQEQTQPQNQSSFIHVAPNSTTTSGVQTPPRSTTPQLKLPKTSQDKIDDVSSKLFNLENEVNSYSVPNDRKRDKKFLLLEESLTQCLLQLDEIDRCDDQINQLRRKLIGTTQRIINLLESRLSDNEQHSEVANENSNNDDNKNSNSSNNSDSKTLKENIQEENNQKT